MWIQVFLSAVFVHQVLSLVSVDSAINLSRSKRNSDDRICLDLMSECRRNSSCHSTYKRVKKSCKSRGRNCLNSRTISRCAVDIDVLRDVTFGTDCRCFGKEMRINKIKVCLKVHNLLFANPCYDFGVKARGADKKISTTPTVTRTVSDVIKHFTTSENGNERDFRSNLFATTTRTINEIESVFKPELGYPTTSKPSLPTFNRVMEGERKELNNELSINREPLRPDILEVKSPTFGESNRSRPLNTMKSDGIGVLKKQNSLNAFLPSDGTQSNLVPIDRDRSDDKQRIDGDSNDNEVAKVVSKYMGKKYEDTKRLAVSQPDDVIEVNELNFDVAESKKLKQDGDTESNGMIVTLTLLVGGSCILLIFIASLAGLCYRRSKKKKLSDEPCNKKKKKKTCHSAIIISSFYDERDLKLNRKPNYV